MLIVGIIVCRKKFMKNDINKWVNLESCSLNSIDFADKCRQKLSDTGVLILPPFLLPKALNHIKKWKKIKRPSST